MSVLTVEASMGGMDPEFRPRYDLTAEELSVLNDQIVASVREAYPQEGIYSALISPSHPYSNFIRGHEAPYFPEVNDFPSELEDDTLLFALVDTRAESDRVVHVGTISGPGLWRPTSTDTLKGEYEPNKTGFLFVDELISLGNFTAAEFEAYYHEKGYDLSKCIAVETNVKVGPSAPKFDGLRTVDLGYLTLFGLIERGAPDIGGAAVFASINRASAISFGRVGIGYEPLMGKSDLLTPESRLGRVSMPVAIPYDENYKTLFGTMGQQLPSITFGTETF